MAWMLWSGSAAFVFPGRRRSIVGHWEGQGRAERFLVDGHGFGFLCFRRRLVTRHLKALLLATPQCLGHSDGVLSSQVRVQLMATHSTVHVLTVLSCRGSSGLNVPQSSGCSTEKHEVVFPVGIFLPRRRDWGQLDGAGRARCIAASVALLLPLASLPSILTSPSVFVLSAVAAGAAAFTAAASAAPGANPGSTPVRPGFVVLLATGILGPVAALGIEPEGPAREVEFGVEGGALKGPEQELGGGHLLGSPVPQPQQESQGVEAEDGDEDAQVPLDVLDREVLSRDDGFPESGRLLVDHVLLL
mmetsp:Transcript_13620/g.39680  ORF Transcript_13620/g.39680 Transcript_13620/m.39680 type:complete len:303 (+) Transcript_13620:214-1122(+)